MCQFLQIWTDLYHRYYNQSKTGVKSTLTSQIKELGAINTFGIKNWINIEPGLVNNDDEKHLNVDGDADVLLLLEEEEGAGLGATTKRNKIVLSQELEKWEIKPF